MNLIDKIINNLLTAVSPQNPHHLAVIGYFLLFTCAITGACITKIIEKNKVVR